MDPVDYFIPQAESATESPFVAAHVDAHTEPGDLVVDPFCRSAAVVAESCRLGRRVVAVSFDYLAALRVRLAVTPVPRGELTAALTRLGDSPKHGTTLREHIQSLYGTECPGCGQPVVAEYFVWEQGEAVPRQARIPCSSCGEVGLSDCGQAKTAGLSVVEPQGLHYWYVLDRVAKTEERGRKYAATLLELYTARNLYALANLGRKIDDLFSDSVAFDFLRLALLQCLEEGSKLSTLPDEPFPGEVVSLRPPQRFVERNIWQLFAETINHLAVRPPGPEVRLADSVSDALAQPPRGSDKAKGDLPAAFVGRLSTRELVRQLADVQARLLCTQPPTIGRDNWALPFLWTGWLYGHEAAATVWPLVRHRNPDWSWYLQAMRTSLYVLDKALAPDGHVVTLGPRREPAYHETLCLAAAATNLQMEQVAYQPAARERGVGPYAASQGECQATWSFGAPSPAWPMPLETLTSKVWQTAIAAAELVLRQRAEPAPFARLHCHIWHALAQQGLLQRIMSIDELAAPPDWAREQVQAALGDRLPGVFVHIWEGDEEGACYWWLAEPPSLAPLSERIERSTCDILESIETTTLADFLIALYKCFPGVLTPDREWAIACLSSYGELVQETRWALRGTDRKAKRLQARRESRERLTALGHRLGFGLRPGSEGFDAQWEIGEKDRVAFAVLDSAALSRLLANSPPASVIRIRRIAVVAEARQELIRLLLNRSVWLRKPLAQQGWQFIREVDLSRWANQEHVTLADLDSIVGLDLLEAEDRTQLSLI